MKESLEARWPEQMRELRASGVMVGMADRIPDSAIVIKGGLSKTSRIDTFEEPGIGQVTGTSASSNPGKTVQDLSALLPHGQVRVITKFLALQLQIQEGDEHRGHPMRF